MKTSLIHNQEGIIGVWVMVIIIIFTGSIIWMPIVMVLSMFSDVMLASPSAPIVEHVVVNAVLNNAAIVEAVIIIGPLFWGFASSFRRETQEY